MAPGINSGIRRGRSPRRRAKAGIGHIGKSHIRKESAVSRVLERHGDHLVPVHIIVAL